MRMELEQYHDELDIQLKNLNDAFQKRAQFMALHLGRLSKVDAIKNIINDAAAHFAETDRSCMDSIIDGKAANSDEDVLDLYQNFAGLVAYLKGKGYIRTQFMPAAAQAPSPTPAALNSGSGTISELDSSGNSRDSPPLISSVVSSPLAPGDSRDNFKFHQLFGSTV